MRIFAASIEQQNHAVIVTCDTGLGTLRGIWRRKNPPVMNSSYDVEFTLADLDSDHVKVLEQNPVECSVRCEKNLVYFTGICEDYDGEIYYIRFRDDGLQMLYLKEEQQSIQIGQTVQFWMDETQVEIFPYELF